MTLLLRSGDVELNPGPMTEEGEITPRGGHSHRRRVQTCDRGQDAVKRSRHFLGVGQMVKQCAGHYLRHHWQSRGVADPFAHAHLIDGQGSREKNRRGEVVKAVFRRSKILTPVAALDTAPMFTMITFISKVGIFHWKFFYELL